MRVNFGDLGFRIFGNQTMTNGHPNALNDVEIMFLHQIIHGQDGTGAAVFDGQNAVIAQTLFHRIENAFERLEIGNVGDLEKLFCCHSAESAFHALAGHGRADGKTFSFFRQDFSYLIDGGRSQIAERILIALALRKDVVVQLLQVDDLIFVRAFGDAGKDGVFALSDVDRKSVLCFFFSDLSAHVHTLQIERG